MARFKQLLPWVVSFGLLAYLAATTDLSRVWAALSGAPVGWVLLTAAVGTAIAFVYDAFCLTRLFARFHRPVSYREVLALKGASYFLNIINYNAAMGGMALYLKRVHRISFLESASSLLFLNVIDVFVLVFLIAGGLLFAGDTLVHALTPDARRALTWVCIGFGGLLVVAWLYWNAGFDFLLFRRLRTWSIFHAFRHATLVDYGRFFVLRLLILLHMISVTWAFAWLFGIAIPVAAMLVLQPIVIFIGTVPISVAGLGTTQVVMRAFFGPFAAYLVLKPGLLALGGGSAALAGAALPGGAAGALAHAEQTVVQAAAAAYLDPTALIDAFSTAAIFGIVFARLVIGYASLRYVAVHLAAPDASSEAPAPARAAAETP